VTYLRSLYIGGIALLGAAAVGLGLAGNSLASWVECAAGGVLIALAALEL
jgi:hypothetical protein